MNSVSTKVRNRRVSSARQRKQQHLLDVTIRESKERERRLRLIAGWFCKLVLVAAVVGGSWFGGKEALRRFVWENPDYFIRDIRFETDGALTREQVLAVSGITEGVNIFTIKLAESRAAVEKLPQVESAEVQRLFPNRIAITVTERRPIAWVVKKADEDAVSSDHSFLIDARSNVMRSRVILPEYLHLPVISGVATENLAPGQRVNSPEVKAALELVRINADNTRFQVRHIDVAKGYCLVVTDQKRAKITFGLDHVDDQLSRLNRLLNAIEPTKKEIQTVNLIPERNLPVTFVPPEPDPVEMPAPPDASAAQKTKAAPTVAPKSTPAKNSAEASAKTKSKSPASGSRRTPEKNLKRPFKLNG